MAQAESAGCACSGHAKRLVTLVSRPWRLPSNAASRLSNLKIGCPDRVGSASASLWRPVAWTARDADRRRLQSNGSFRDCVAAGGHGSKLVATARDVAACPLTFNLNCGRRTRG